MLRAAIRWLPAMALLLAVRPAAAMNFDIPAGDTAAFAQAITSANANPDPDVITLASGAIYSFATPTEGNTALPSITTAVTIEANGSIIERTAGSLEDMRIFRLAFNANLTLRNAIVKGGRVNGQGVGGGAMLITSGQATIESCTFQFNECNGGFGGAIYVASSPVVVRDSTFDNNQAAIGGGIAVFATGGVTIERTRLTNNHAQAAGPTPATGGGIAIVNGGSATLRDVELSSNQAEGSTTLDGLGGGIANDSGACTLDRVLIGGNIASADGTANALGGGIYAIGNGPSFTITNTTITGNVAFANGSGAKDGGGMYVNAVNSISTLNNVTIALNDLGAMPDYRGGGIFLGNPGSVGTDSFTISNTILGDNESGTGPDCFTGASKAILSGGHNLIKSTGGCTFTSQGSDHTGLALHLGPLADNGGFLDTMGLQDGSPAIDGGSDATLGTSGACEALDQRCFGRPAGVRCDVGAFEKDAVLACTTTTTLPGSSTTTTTLAGSTTTTTLPGCEIGATFSSIACRLDALVARASAATDLGKLQKALVKGATAARTKSGQAETLADAGKSKPAKKKLKQARKRLTAFIHRLSSNAARKKVPGETRTGLIDDATPIQAALATLSGSLP